MPRNNDPTEALALVNTAITRAIRQLHSLQGAVKKGSLHLMLSNHPKPCLGCPHYIWKIWMPKRAKRGNGIGEFFPIATECKAPTRSGAARSNPKVMEIVLILLRLLEQRARLVESMSRANRSAQATVKLLEDYAS